jgi:heme exporter protein D
VIDLGPHAAFIVAAYAAVFLGVIGAVLWVGFDARRVADRLARLEARGIRRRSGGNLST